MSVFGSSTTSAICADYFGDEFGLPLPPPPPPITKNNRTVVSKSTTTLLQNNRADNQSNSSNTDTKPRRVALAFAPNFDGLDFFETLVRRSN
ncbi:hypothetical protein Ddye_002973 [Dipteronia dyeriana]|uniref:Uncharacterized protein n=1 Tax=Dipteronia dyeriana TaxID=168575 RepID=A0AAD9XRF3_9ROSI|nr:hypothetical protein Ddye_002973 [Dipteronia dyeriana]